MLKKTNVIKKAEGLQDAVLSWFAVYGRDFPWRKTNNAFFILIAEALLRQTQARRVAGPYLDLISRFPDPHSLAQANITQLREWFQPLGLVKRADRLVETSKFLVRDFVGRVPNGLDQLKELPGLGEYSARAVLCLAYNIQVPMIDEGSGESSEAGFEPSLYKASILGSQADRRCRKAAAERIRKELQPWSNRYSCCLLP